MSTTIVATLSYNATWPETERPEASVPFCSVDCWCQYRDTYTPADQLPNVPAVLQLAGYPQYEFDETCANCGVKIPASA